MKTGEREDPEETFPDAGHNVGVAPEGRKPFLQPDQASSYPPLGNHPTSQGKWVRHATRFP